MDLRRLLSLLKSFVAGLAFLSGFAPCAGAQHTPPATMAEAAPSFEVAAIKPSKPGDGNHDWDESPGRLSIENYTLRQLVRSAYGLKSDSQVLGGPKWLDDERFDILAKADDLETAMLQKMNRKQRASARTLMLQSLLFERFKLQVSSAQRDLPVYALVVAGSGIRFGAAMPGEKGGDLSVRNSSMTATGISMDSLADYLGTQIEAGDRVVENRTGLAGEYDFKMNWTRDRGNGIPPDAEYPGLFTALKEQLGLKLVPAKGRVPVLVVESASEPAFD